MVAKVADSKIGPRHYAGGLLFLRTLIILVVCLGLAGCGGLRRLPSPGIATDAIEVVVFNDGFHSGLLVPNRPELNWLDTQDDAIAKWPWLEIGFGADDWINAQEGTSLSKTRLALMGSAGVLMLEHYQTPTRPDRNPGTPSKFWHLRFTPEAWARMVDFLKPWTDTSIVRLRQGDETRFFVFSPIQWTITQNCHDFVLDWLAAGGLPTVWQAGTTSDWFRLKIDEVVRQLQDGGISVVDCEPDPEM